MKVSRCHFKPNLEEQAMKEQPIEEQHREKSSKKKPALALKASLLGFGYILILPVIGLVGITLLIMR